MQDFGGRVAFVAENFADSALARRFGVTRYPAFFVGDVLVATPKDFGFFGTGEGEDVARYAPFQSAEGHAHFRADVARAVQRALAGEAVAAAPRPAAGVPVAALPDLRLVDLDGHELRRQDLIGKVVVVDFWATWCPPCRGALPWVAGLRERFGDGVAVVALAVDSDEKVVREIAARHGAGVRWAMATPAIGRGFGDVSSLPTMFVFDEKGACASVFYGAPPSLHADVERVIAEQLR